MTNPTMEERLHISAEALYKCQKNTQELIALAVEKREGEIKAEYIRKVLLDSHENYLQGKDYDFFFVLKTDLDKITSSLLTTKE